MLMIIALAPFNVAAYRGYPWRTLYLVIPLALLAGLLDSPPNFEELRIFASDVCKVLTKAIFVGTVSFAVCRLAGRLFRKRVKPSPPVAPAKFQQPARRSGGSLLDFVDHP